MTIGVMSILLSGGHPIFIINDIYKYIMGAISLFNLRNTMIKMKGTFNCLRKGAWALAGLLW